MKKILHVTDYQERAIWDFVSRKFPVDVDFAGTLERALTMPHDTYDAIVFDTQFRRGNIKSNTYELGLADFPLLNDPTYGSLGGTPDDWYYDKRPSDKNNGLILAFLARLPDSIGGLGYRGGLMILTPADYDAVKDSYEPNRFRIRTLGERLEFYDDILFLSNQNERWLSKLKNAVERVTAYHHKGPFEGQLIHGMGTVYSMS